MLFAATPVVEEDLVNGPMGQRKAKKMQEVHDIPNRQSTKAIAWALARCVVPFQKYTEPLSNQTNNPGKL